jgi:hypothetical protein
MTAESQTRFRNRDHLDDDARRSIPWLTRVEGRAFFAFIRKAGVIRTAIFFPAAKKAVHDVFILDWESPQKALPRQRPPPIRYFISREN